MNTLTSLRRGSMLILLTAFFLALPCLAQSSQNAGLVGKAGKDASCDGALEIVPTKEVSFARKRRPGKSKPVQNKNINSKTSVQANQ